MKVCYNHTVSDNNTKSRNDSLLYQKADRRNIRNFSIIAHVDHGKSTLSDALIQKCGVNINTAEGPSLDSMELEKERGVTIKAQTVRLNYQYQGENYILNLIDSPGHVDFRGEVARVTTVCQGSLLIVDSTQGIEAQTLSHLQKAINASHVIIPIISKIDLPNADIERVRKQIHDVLGEVKCFSVSAKTGEGVIDIIHEIIKQIPSPSGNEDSPLQALIIDSWYNEYLGVSVLFCVRNGQINCQDEIFMMSTPEKTLKVAKLGVFNPRPTDISSLGPGEIGFLSSFSKEIMFNVGDTITTTKNPSKEPLPGFSKSLCTVYCFFLLHENAMFEQVKKAMAKLQLNDASFFFEHEHIEGWGVGFKCGFLGMFHMEIIKERLLREAGIDVIITSPSVQYKLEKNGKEIIMNSANMFPSKQEIRQCSVKEPMTRCQIVCPTRYVGAVLTFCVECRGVEESINYVGDSCIMEFKIPLNEMITNFQERLCSLTNGYCSFDYEIIGFEPSDLVKLEILVNKEPLDVLSTVVHRSKAYQKAKVICEHLKEILPKQQVSQAIQGVVDGKVIVREDISAYRKDVLVKCYGGDVTRKNKLLEKQKKGKEKMQGLSKNIRINSNDLIKIIRMS